MNELLSSGLMRQIVDAYKDYTHTIQRAAQVCCILRMYKDAADAFDHVLEERQPQFDYKDTDESDQLMGVIP